MTLFDMYDVEDQGELLTKDLCAAMAKTFGLAVEDITKVLLYVYWQPHNIMTS
jgi:hypothetical protein